ncbi:MAG: DNA alkylation repair protein [Terracidiphilus sp.]|jgi:3-methyladenine DNA glycosylase AlkD
MAEMADKKIAAFHRAVRAALEPLADAKRARDMRAYMRNKFEYIGVGTPERRAAVAAPIRAFQPADAAELRQAAEGLWQMSLREYQYVALDLLARYQTLLSLDDLPWLLDRVQEKSWWDSVDALLQAIGPVVERAGAKGKRAMDAAVRNENLWVRRIAMLHQLGLRGETDTERLFRYAEMLAPEGEFFIRKAIGWALRDYAWHDWRAVEKFLKSTRVELSGLTVREASKNFAALRKRGLPGGSPKRPKA